MSSGALPAGCQSRVVDVNGTRIHCVEAGEGPLVLLVHGFPESWYSWRHQLRPWPRQATTSLRSTCVGTAGRPSRFEIEQYRMVRLVADNVGLVAALGEQTAVIVGHDWGAPIAWTSALLRPDVFTAVAGLSVPFSPPSPHRPFEVMRAMAGDEGSTSSTSRSPAGPSERSKPTSAAGCSASCSPPPAARPAPDPAAGSIATIPHSAAMKDRFHRPDPLPSWLTEDDLDVYAEEFEHSGFRGPLNRYRNVDRDWEDLAAFRGASIQVPALFVGGDRDGPTI
ncbi:MAG: alpha/beta hydrolase [Acidimicrobiales bacterium]